MPMPPEFAVVDLKLAEQSGLKVVAQLKAADPHTRIVVLTGHASIPTAVEAIKLGATYYLTKPTDADAVVAAFAPRGRRRRMCPSTPADDGRASGVGAHPARPPRHGGNVSATARALSMHRRTLQRKLRRPPAE